MSHNSTRTHIRPELPSKKISDIREEEGNMDDWLSPLIPPTGTTINNDHAYDYMSDWERDSNKITVIVEKKSKKSTIIKPKTRLSNGKKTSKKPSQQQPKLNSIQKAIQMGQFEELNKAIELSDSQKYTIKTLEKEVKELKMALRKSEKALSQFEKEQKDIPQLVHSLTEEIRILRLDRKNLQEKLQNAEKNTSGHMEEILRLQDDVGKLTTIIKSKNLYDAGKLQAEINSLSTQLESSQQALKDSLRKEKHAENEKGMEVREWKTKYNQMKMDYSVLNLKFNEVELKLKETEKKLSALQIHSRNLQVHTRTITNSRHRQVTNTKSIIPTEPLDEVVEEVTQKSVISPIKRSESRNELSSREDLERPSSHQKRTTSDGIISPSLENLKKMTSQVEVLSRNSTSKKSMLPVPSVGQSKSKTSLIETFEETNKSSKLSRPTFEHKPSKEKLDDNSNTQSQNVFKPLFKPQPFQKKPFEKQEELHVEVEAAEQKNSFKPNLFKPLITKSNTSLVNDTNKTTSVDDFFQTTTEPEIKTKAEEVGFSFSSIPTASEVKPGDSSAGFSFASIPEKGYSFGDMPGMGLNKEEDTSKTDLLEKQADDYFNAMENEEEEETNVKTGVTLKNSEAKLFNNDSIISRSNNNIFTPKKQINKSNNEMFMESPGGQAKNVVDFSVEDVNYASDFDDDIVEEFI